MKFALTFIFILAGTPTLADSAEPFATVRISPDTGILRDGEYVSPWEFMRLDVAGLAKARNIESLEFEAIAIDPQRLDVAVLPATVGQNVDAFHLTLHQRPEPVDDYGSKKELSRAADKAIEILQRKTGKSKVLNVQLTTIHGYPAVEVAIRTDWVRYDREQEKPMRDYLHSLLVVVAGKNHIADLRVTRRAYGNPPERLTTESLREIFVALEHHTTFSERF